MPTASTPSAAPAHVTLPCASCGRWNRIAAARMTDHPKCGACGTAIHLDHPVPLSDQTFERVVRESTLPVLVDFYADWCGPCRMMAPAVDEVARTSAGRALVAKLDTDVAQRTSARFQIRGIPTVIAFRNGVETTRQSGVMTVAALRAMI